MREEGAKGKTKRNGGKREEGRRQERTRRQGSRKEAPKAFCIWAAGRRIRWRVLGLIIKTGKIGLFVRDPKKFNF